MIYFILGIIIVLITTVLRNRLNNQFVFDHFTLFSLGFVFYWLIPLFVMNTATGKKMFVELNNYYSQINSFVLFLYFCICFILFFSYLLGMHIGTKWKIGTTNYFKFSRTINSILIIPFILLMSFLSFKFRSKLFKGYSIDDNIDMTAKGALVAGSLCLLVFSLIKFNKNARKNIINKSNTSIWNLYFFYYFCFAIIILSLGGRLYFLSSVLVMFLLYHNYIKQFNFKKIILTLLILTVLFSLLGVLRDGVSSVSMTSILFVFLAEPIFTSFSLFSYLALNPIKLISFPIILISSFINLIPTAVLPGKANLYLYPSDFGITIKAPQGAMHSFTSFNYNFGVLGTVLFMIFFGFFMEKLIKKNNELSMTIYYMLCFCLPFTFFRDDFQTSIVKNMFQFSIFIPFLYYLINRFILNSVIKISKK